MALLAVLGLALRPAPSLSGAQAVPRDAESLLREGLRLYDAGDARGALLAWQQGLEVALKEKDELFAGSFYGNIGMAYALLGEHARAAEYLESSLRMARSSGDRLGEKNRLNNLASLYLLMGKTARAHELYLQALRIARDTRDRKLEAIALGNIGQVLHAESRSKEALAKLGQGLAVAVELEDRTLEADLLSTLGLAYGAVGNFGQGLGHFRRAIQIGDAGRRIRDHNRMGVLQREAGDPRGAAASHQKAADLASQLSDRQGEAESRRFLERALADYNPEAGEGEENLLRRAVEGLERMLERLRANGIEREAREVEESLSAQRKKLQRIKAP